MILYINVIIPNKQLLILMFYLYYVVKYKIIYMLSNYMDSMYFELLFHLVCVMALKQKDEAYLMYSIYFYNICRFAFVMLVR